MTQQQIQNLGQRWADAERRADVDALDALFSDDFSAIGPRGFVLNRQQWLDRYRSGSIKNETFTWQETGVRAYRDAIIATGTQTQQSTYQGQDASGRFRTTLVYVHGKNGWRIALIQLSGPIPDMPQR